MMQNTACYFILLGKELPHWTKWRGGGEKRTNSQWWCLLSKLWRDRVAEEASISELKIQVCWILVQKVLEEVRNEGSDFVGYCPKAIWKSSNRNEKGISKLA